jgi:hypothetical protein
MKKLVMLLVVLALCMPAYGYILVYKLTMSGTRAETSDDTWLLGKESDCSYLVLDVNDTNANVLNEVELVDYYTETWDHTKHKQYEIETGGLNFKQTILPGLPPGKNIVRVDIDLTDARGLLLGTVSLTDIGNTPLGVTPKWKENVATSLKGVCESESFADNNTPDAIGYGTLSGTLDLKWTKTANNPDSSKGFGGVIGDFLDSTSGPCPQGLIYWLENIGKYMPATD